ncbi:1,4-dihydroxy-2-naphthoate octaprenyltransferase [Flavobacterium difficile]|uniref:1,4-dihydroxy-2-naphthoate octaprenyltransferase n=1 Tax=Flavobacterium difficile TaxID=2709659 RepID=A0ABX0I502_9FLAO|nr:1,4-dihydroxy-2-naphthoate octaprenyltransferase [Flavobacterium difficile]NHM01175.1 1,4-dihydroxy-2-naphthoate octaprenyltransferase [Flavobacterium difficile]
MNTKSWIQAARLRTLPLSISGILVGSAYAYYQNKFEWIIFVLALLTTLSFQILSNFANDYGDGIKGTDANRIGEKRLVASGEITSEQMKKAIIINGIIAFVLAVALIYFAFGQENFVYSITFLVLGIASIAAAIKYTVGNNAYGYSGFGDVFVFIFFGLVAVVGSNFLYSKSIDIKLFLPAIAIGMLSTAVLNLNNMRDIENDRIANKNTLVVKFGLKFGLWYQRILIFVPVILYLLFLFDFKNGNLGFSILFFYLAISHNTTITKIVAMATPNEFDPHLKKVALSTFLYAILISLKLISG